jgi:PAS domain S-box-containing protein
MTDGTKGAAIDVTPTAAEVPMEHFAALGRLVHVMNGDADLIETMHVALQAVLDVLGYDGGGIYVVDHAAGTAHVRCSVDLPEDFLGEVAVVRTDAPVYARIFVDGEPVVAEDYAKLRPDRAKRWGFKSMASVPLPYGGTVFGALNVASRSRRRITEEELALLIAVGEQLGMAFSRARVVEELRRAEDNLRAFFELSPDMLFVLDGQGDVVELNHEATRQLGYETDAIRGRSVFDLHPGDQRDRVVNTVTRMLSGMEENCTVPLLTSQGHEIPVETRVSHGRWNGAEALFGICRASRSDRVLRAAVLALNGALEMRDPCTAQHVRNVAPLSDALAVEMGLPPDRVELVRIAAELHDIGVLGIPATILSKAGPLSRAERMLVNEHPGLGYELLRPMEFLGPIPDIVMQHHERLDGSGYPGGLTGDEILLEARIIAVADVVEAMSAHRAYRPALPFRDALAELRRGAGKTYDADAAAAVQSLWKRDEIPLEAAHAAARHRRSLRAEVTGTDVRGESED